MLLCVAFRGSGTDFLCLPDSKNSNTFPFGKCYTFIPHIIEGCVSIDCGLLVSLLLRFLLACLNVCCLRLISLFDMRNLVRFKLSKFLCFRPN